MDGSTQDISIVLKHTTEEGSSVKLGHGRTFKRDREEKNKANNLPKNYGKRWTPEDEEYLRKEYGLNKKSIHEVNVYLERTESSVSSHLFQMGILRLDDNYTFKSFFNLIKTIDNSDDQNQKNPNKLVMLLTILALIYNKNYNNHFVYFDDFLKNMFMKCWSKNIPSTAIVSPDSEMAFQMLRKSKLCKEEMENAFVLDTRYFKIVQDKTVYTAIKKLILDLISMCL